MRYMYITFAITLILTVGSLSAKPKKTLLKKVSGDVTVLVDGKWIPARVNQILVGTETIKTGNKSMTLLRYGKSEIQIFENSEMRLINLDENGGSVNLQSGFSWYNVPKAKNGFHVTTPTAIASVRGTKFAVASDSRGSVSCVCKGSITVKSTADQKESVVSKGESSSQPARGDSSVHDYAKYFNGKYVDSGFQSEITREPKLNSCLNCHVVQDARSHANEHSDYFN